MQNENFKKGYEFYQAKDYERAFICFQAGAVQDCALSKLKLAQMYFFAKGVNQDYKKAKYYYEQAAQKSHVALLNLGVIYFNGFGVQKDYERAKEYYKLAASLGNKKANLNLADIFFNGYGTKVDYKKAKSYYEKASKDEPLANFGLGEIYFHGFETKKDMQKAVYHYEKAATANSFEAIKRLSFIYYKFGHFQKAKKNFLLLKNFGFKGSEFYLGNIFYFEENYEAAIEFFEYALKNGYKEANLYLGNIFYFGNGVKKDLLIAKKYFDKLPNNPLAKARINLIQKMGA